MFYGVVLAAGNSSRFKGTKHKSLYSMWGKEIIRYNVDLIRKYTNKIYVVIQEKHKKDFASVLKDVTFIFQKEPKGTADAYRCALNEICDDGLVLVCNGDTIMLEDFIPAFLLNHLSNKAKASLMAVLANENGASIIEKDNSFYIDENKKNSLLKNAGYYLFDLKESKKVIDKIPSINNEIFITKIFDYIDNKAIFEYHNSDSYYSINTKEDFYNASVLIQKKIQMNLIKNNVFLIGNSLIDFTSKIEKNVTLINCCIRGNTLIKEGCFIDNSVIENSILEQDVHVGPFSHIRDNCHINQNAYVGNFVEMKNTVVGQKTKMKHQCLLNDCLIGKYVNIGAGCVSANYDGKEKNQTIIKDQVFIGCNATLIAPLTLEKNSMIGAGSTIYEDVSSSMLAIARSKQITKQRKIDI